jgi:molecular chaperone GrpE
MASHRHHPKDQPYRDGGVVDPTDAQLEGATSDGAPGPDDAETIDFAHPAREASGLEAELAAERDRNLRLRAELENVRSRSSREISENLKYAALPLVRDLLPALDNIDRALEAATKSGDSGALVEGFHMVRDQILSILQRHDFREIPAQGELFDPKHHAAILQQPSADVPAGHVIMVTQPGYQVHDRVVRPSQVIVSSGPA